MRLLIQRVLSASVIVDQKTVGQIDKGLLLYIGFAKTDTEQHLSKAVEKLINYRLFDDENQKPHFSTLDIQSDILCVSQFTLYGRLDKGRRPDFGDALNGPQAEILYNQFVEKLKQTTLNIQTGVFAADMQVHSVNDGPFTFFHEFV